jgi:pimeloyl-ACP methyl ester carboxylesterase
MQVVVQSLLTNYIRKGTGKKLLLLHGWGDNVAGLKPLIDSLSLKNEVVALDLPGFGGTQSPIESWSLDEYAVFVKEFLQKINYKTNVVIGHSNGGAIAIRASSKGLESDKLVLIASSGVRGEYKGKVKILRLVTKTGKLLASPLPKKLKKNLRSKVYQSVGSDMLVAEHLQETFKRIVTDDIRSDAVNISQPTLLLYGDKDSSTPVEIGKKIAAKIKNSQLVVISNAGHMLPTEKTKEITDNIMGFIA